MCKRERGNRRTFSNIQFSVTTDGAAYIQNISDCYLFFLKKRNKAYITQREGIFHRILIFYGHAFILTHVEAGRKKSTWWSVEGVYLMFSQGRWNLKYFHHFFPFLALLNNRSGWLCYWSSKNKNSACCYYIDKWSILLNFWSSTFLYIYQILIILQKSLHR